MMKMSGRVVSCCVALFLVLTSVSAVQKLNSIEDLKKINFGQSVPKHSLVLLHWFANIVDIDEDVIRLTFNPNGDYGSHHYRNAENILDPLPPGRYQYYTVGNLNKHTSVPLPRYVVRPPTEEYVGTNMDRIIFRVREPNTGRQAWQTIDQVYITQHYEMPYTGARYDPAYTYEITTNLLREIREFSVEENQVNFRSNADYSQLMLLRNTWGDLACLGLLLYIVIQDKHPSKQHNNRPPHPARRNSQPESLAINMPEDGQYCMNDIEECCQICRFIFMFIVLIFGLVFLSYLNIYGK